MGNGRFGRRFSWGFAGLALVLALLAVSTLSPMSPPDRPPARPSGSVPSLPPSMDLYAEERTVVSNADPLVMELTAADKQREREGL